MMLFNISLGCNCARENYIGNIKVYDVKKIIIILRASNALLQEDNINIFSCSWRNVPQMLTVRR
jgi:hypothetical protein